MLKDFLKTKREPTRAERQRAKFEAWSAGLTRLYRTIQDLEGRRADAEQVVRAAARQTFEGEPFDMTGEFREAARTISDTNAILPVVRQLHREERARNLSPAQRRRMRPVKVDSGHEGTDMSGVLGGAYEMVPAGEE